MSIYVNVVNIPMMPPDPAPEMMHLYRNCAPKAGCGCNFCDWAENWCDWELPRRFSRWIEDLVCSAIESNDGHLELLLIFRDVQVCKRLSPELKKNLYDNIRIKL